jgi:hypothetical protein
VVKLGIDVACDCAGLEATVALCEVVVDSLESVAAIGERGHGIHRDSNQEMKPDGATCDGTVSAGVRLRKADAHSIDRAFTREHVAVRCHAHTVAMDLQVLAHP